METVLTRASESIVFGLKSIKKSTKVVKKRWRICSGPNSHSYYGVFSKSQKALHWLTFSHFTSFIFFAKFHFDHRLDHLQKTQFFIKSRCSAAGSARHSGCRGPEFKSPHLDQKALKTLSFQGFFFIYCDAK